MICKILEAIFVPKILQITEFYTKKNAMKNFESKIFPAMNNFLDRLRSVLLVFVSLGVLSKNQMKFVLCFYDEEKDIKTSEPIGYSLYEFSQEKIFQETCLKNFYSKENLKKVKMFPLKGNCVGICSEFENPKLDQAILLLWVVVMNLIIDHPDINQDHKMFFYIVQKEAERVRKSLKINNPYIGEIVKMMKNMKVRREHLILS